MRAATRAAARSTRDASSGVAPRNSVVPRNSVAIAPPSRGSKTRLVRAADADAARPPTGALAALTVLNFLLLATHVVIGLWIERQTIAFPLSVFETRLTSSVLRQFECVYTLSPTGNDGEPYCSDSAYNTSALRGRCADVAVNRSTVELFQEPGGSPLLGAYNLRRFEFGMSEYTDGDGRDMTKQLLLLIAFLTAGFHLVYTLQFGVMAAQALRGQRRLLGRSVAAGGVAARWVEYSLTAALMSAFVGNVANVFDVYALFGFFAGTFAMQYFGLAAERFAAQGESALALGLIYVPGGALFALTWLPLVRQLHLDVFRLSCAASSSSWFDCASTCFGSEVPIYAFTMVLVLLFLVFPLVAVAKIYFLGGYDRLARGVSVAPLRGLLNAVLFVGFFLVVAPLVAVYALIVQSVVPLGNPLARKTVLSSTKQSTFLYGELLYALASATSKVFLYVFFVMSFSTRDW